MKKQIQWLMKLFRWLHVQSQYYKYVSATLGVRPDKLCSLVVTYNLTRIALLPRWKIYNILAYFDSKTSCLTMDYQGELNGVIFQLLHFEHRNIHNIVTSDLHYDTQIYWCLHRCSQTEDVGGEHYKMVMVTYFKWLTHPSITVLYTYSKWLWQHPIHFYRHATHRDLHILTNNGLD